MLGVRITLPAVTDASFGAALLAGVGAGVFANEAAAAAQCISEGEVIAPDAKRHAYYTQLFALYQQAQKALAPVSHDLAQLPATLIR